ncbi:MAG: hypothetical protein JWP10_1709 [Nocardioidaceae bacterium]|nr:hypothetical protein [Nocardioidaceae bacterium]
MALFGRRRKSRTTGGAAVSDRGASKEDQQHLRDFIESRQGVEGFVEPRTSVTQTTLLLVALDGESTRRRVPSSDWAASFLKKLNIPCYDTNRVGYPQRMRDYNLRQERGGSTLRTQPTAPAQSPAELAALMTIESVAGVDPLPTNPTQEALERVWRKARAQAHPDRHAGDRKRWDQIEDAGRVLGLLD